MAVNPFVRTLGLQQLLQREAQAVPEVRDIDDPQAESALAGHIRHAWGRNKLAKEKIERRMLDCLRARRGQYSATALALIQANGGLNVVWHDLTETKCRAASAWVREIVLPTGERPWAAEPTPIPDLPVELKQRVVDKAVKQAMQVMQAMAEQAGVVMERSEFRKTVAELGDKLREDAERELRKAAKRRAQRMERVISDRQAQGGWEEALDGFVEDFVTYPAAFLHGPIYRRQKRLQWGDGWTPKVTDAPVQTWERISPFDVYPALGSVDCQTGDMIVRRRFQRSELHDLKGLPGYQDAEIDKALREYSAGHLEGWLWSEAERQRLEAETTYLFLTPPGIIDALDYWGSVPGWQLMAWGVADDLEPTRDYECNVLMVGRFVVYCALNPNPVGTRPYRKACYDEIPGSFWGRSIPDLIATQQQMCNAITCAVADNLGDASSFQAWVHIDRLADGEQSLEIVPRKVWQLKSDPTQGTNPGVGFFAPPNNAPTFMQMLAEWEQRADDASGVPRYTYGNGAAAGAGDTASGLAMLMNNAAKGLRRAIANIDLRVIQPTIADAFVNEMLYNPDESIKGDCIIVPRGAAAILIKESAQLRRTQFLAATANPIDMAIIGAKGRAALLREVVQSMELPPIVPEDEELEQREAAQAEAQQAQMQMQMQAGAMQQQAQAEERIATTQAKAAADRESQTLGIIGDLVKQAVQGAVTARAPRKLRYSYDDSGRIAGAEAADEA